MLTTPHPLIGTTQDLLMRQIYRTVWRQRCGNVISTTTDGVIYQVGYRAWLIAKEQTYGKFTSASGQQSSLVGGEAPISLVSPHKTSKACMTRKLKATSRWFQRSNSRIISLHYQKSISPEFVWSPLAPLTLIIVIT